MTTRSHIAFYINGRRVTASDKRAFMPLADFLREEKSLTGTKIVCAEGDCGACTVIQGNLTSDGMDVEFKPFNSCITPVYLLDGSHVVTVDALDSCGELDSVQSAFVGCHASQCGFCTPGFIMSTTAMMERKDQPTKKDVQNYLTGNLCRCTGYDAIIDAGQSIDPMEYIPLKARFHTEAISEDLRAIRQQALGLSDGRYRYFAPTSLQSALELVQTEKPQLIAGSTDLGVQINKGRNTNTIFLSLALVPEAQVLKDEGDSIRIGASVTWESIRRFLKESSPQFADFIHLFASPQIKNVGTLVGNVANASPIADAIGYLMMMEATIHLAGPNGERDVPIVDFYLGYKKLNMESGEIILSISIPKPTANQTIKVYKISARRDLDISCVNAAILLEENNGVIQDIRLAYGGIGPVVKRLRETESALLGQHVSKDNFFAASKLISTEITPISDVRGSARFRHQVSRNLLKRFFVETQNTLEQP